MSEQVVKRYDSFQIDPVSGKSGNVTFVLATDYDALPAKAEALRAENVRKQQTIDGMNAEHWKLVQAHAAQAKELEAARGLLDVARSKLETLKGDPVGVGELLGDIDALLTTTPAPEVPDHIAEASKMVTPEAQQDEDAWQTLHAISKAPQDGEKLTAERLHAICEIGHDRKAFIARLAEQVDRQEAVGWIVDWPDKPGLGFYFSSAPNENARSRPLYTTPQPGLDVRGLVRVGQQMANSCYNLSQFEIIGDANVRSQLRELAKGWDEAIAAHHQAQQGEQP